ALIMFTDADSSHNCIYGRRYPAENDPGIPLFDYPDNIGYFDVTSSNKQFTNQKPEGGTPVPTGGQLTIYVENNAGWNPLRMGYWTATSKHPYGDWGNRASMSKTTIGGTTYDTYTIDKTYNGENISELKFTDNSDSAGTNNLNVSSYTSNSNITAITLRITGANQNIQVVSTSAPSGEVTETLTNSLPAGKYRLTTNNASGFRIWVWTKNGSSDVEAPTDASYNWNDRPTLSASNPYNFTLNQSGATEFWYKKNDDSDTKANLSDFVKVGDTWVLNIN
ncbi:MAG: hypothetical protein K2J05_03770, partial [Muribaculaceae bacterium]|nr:hypothetical protein [Muribaculaceae bacterium]